MKRSLSSFPENIFKEVPFFQSSLPPFSEIHVPDRAEVRNALRILCKKLAALRQEQRDHSLRAAPQHKYMKRKTAKAARRDAAELRFPRLRFQAGATKAQKVFPKQDKESEKRKGNCWLGWARWGAKKFRYGPVLINHTALIITRFPQANSALTLAT